MLEYFPKMTIHKANECLLYADIVRLSILVIISLSLKTLHFQFKCKMSYIFPLRLRYPLLYVYKPTGHRYINPAHTITLDALRNYNPPLSPRTPGRGQVRANLAENYTDRHVLPSTADALAFFYIGPTYP